MDKLKETRLRHAFDSYCKKVLRNAANDYYDEITRRHRHEVLLEDCRDIPYTTDLYFREAYVYRVFDAEIPISDHALADALNTLSSDNRTIVLASYCMGLPDRVVAEQLNLVRRTVAYRRSKALLELRGWLSNV